MSMISLQTPVINTTPLTPQETEQVQQMAASAQADARQQMQRDELEANYQREILELEASQRFLTEQVPLLQAEQAALMQQIALLEQTNRERKEAYDQLESLLPVQIQSTIAQANALAGRTRAIRCYEDAAFVSRALDAVHAGLNPQII